MHSVHIHGWRGITHSFCLVNQYQLFYLKKFGLNLYHTEAPFINPSWSRTSASCGFPVAIQSVVDQIGEPPPGFIPDYIYTIFYPLDLHKRRSRHTFVFSVNEYQELSSKTLDGNFYHAQGRDDISIVTPSQWSKIGYLKWGFDEKQVIVVPHGFDSNIFKPSSQPRQELKRLLGFSVEDFLIGTAGTMTFNKGIDVLLRAFHELSLRRANVHLILKDASCLGYLNGNAVVHSFCESAGIRFNEDQAKRIHVISNNLTQAQMASFFQAVDVYVSTYRAEGFGLTPLEAAGCGAPIIVTKGGSTDEYANDAGAFFISSQPCVYSGKSYLEPSLEDLLSNLTHLYDQGPRCCACIDQARRLEMHWDWSVVSKRLASLFA